MASHSTKVASVMGSLIKEARFFGCSMSPNGETWADQFKDSPFYQQALEIQKDEAGMDVTRAQRRAAQDMEMAQESMFRVRQSELDAQLAAWKYENMGLTSSAEPAMTVGGPAGEPPGMPAEAPAPMGAAPNVMPPKAASIWRVVNAMKIATGDGVAGASTAEDDANTKLPKRAKKDLPEEGKSVEGKQQLKKEKEKTASLLDYSVLCRQIEAGALGKEASAALEGILSNFPEATKVASADTSSHNEDGNDDRKRRLAELLRKRQPTGLDGGSASPNPSRDSC